MGVPDIKMRIPGYQITGNLGDGGTSTVYKGIQLSLKRQVAIKVLKRNLLEQNEIRKRFARESLIIARLIHPNIIQVIDQGITDDGLPFFVMSYVDGITLEQAFKQEKLSQERAVDIFTQIAKALSFAHRNNVIHCDIKPQNIIVDREGTARVLDFGIAQIFSRYDKKRKSGKDFIMGSPSYMAPEQNISASHASKKSDLYSLGVMMYQYFTRQLPGNKHSGNNKVPPIKINPTMKLDLSTLIMQCLEDKPDRRPKSASEIKNRLLTALQGKHLDQEQHERAEIDLSKEFQLLDVLKETKHGALYLFQEKRSAELFVIKKKPVWQSGLDASLQIKAIEHPNIARIYGTSKNERNFIVVSEYCTGGSLEDQVTRPYSVGEFLPMAIAISGGLSVAHKEGVLHGNLRPSNILFNEEGTIKITDFGMSEHYRESSKEENWYSLENEELSEAYDIYSLGVVFHLMLTGELPKRKHMKFSPEEKFKALPKELQSLIRQMLRMDPSKRISNAKALCLFLQKMQEGDETVIRPKEFKSKLVEKESSADEGVVEKRRPKIALLLVLWAAMLLLWGGQTIYFVPELKERFNAKIEQLKNRF